MAEVSRGHHPGPYNPHQLGGRAFSHNQDNGVEAEYERLRGLARQEHDKRARCFDQSHHAYERGDGAAAKELSEEGKRHGAMMEQYNKQASDYIFRENNAVDRVPADTIDLHGQYVEEAEEIVEARVKYAKQHGQTHLHIIVGKGIHSQDHVQKLKPRVEQVCQQLGLQYATEENTGRIYVNLQGGPAVMPPLPNYPSPSQQQQQPYGGGNAGYPGAGGRPQQQLQQGGYQQQQGQQQDEDLGTTVVRVLRKCCGGCTIM